MSEFDPYKKVYTAQGARHSIMDLLMNFADPKLEVDGISRVSDLHMKVGEPVRYRYDGEMETMPGGEPLAEETIRELIYPLINETQRKKFTENPREDLDVSFVWNEREISFRLNIFHDRDGIACVMRMLPKHIPEIDEIGFLNDRVWRDLVALKQGLVLVTGVTSSGKSTTIASILDYINKSRKLRIITLEDPIEFVFSSEQALISQRELGAHLETFGAGLRSALREDPDIIYVGEIRDSETAQLALTAAETGHLVFSTLHTKDVKGAFSRLIDMFPGERSSEIATQLSFSLSYAISQKLLLHRSGTKRVPVFEALKNTPVLAHLIRNERFHQVYSQMETGQKEGMNTLEQHLVALVEQGAITREQAIAYANDASVANRLD